MKYNTILIETATGIEHTFSHILTIGIIDYYVTTMNRFLRLHQFVIKEELTETV